MSFSCWGVIIACGKGQQFSPEISTPFINLAGKPILVHVLTAYEQCPDIKGIVVVTDKTRTDSVLGMAQMFGLSKVKKVLAGFSARLPSIHAALTSLDEDINLVVIQDGARPFLKADLISEVIKTAKRFGAAVAANPVQDGIKETLKGQTVGKSVKGGAFWLIQTPRAYRRDILEKGLRAAAKKKMDLEDESAALDLVKQPVRLVESSPSNLAIRSGADFALAMALLKG